MAMKPLPLVLRVLEFAQRLAGALEGPRDTLAFTEDILNVALDMAAADGVGLLLTSADGVVYHELSAAPRAFSTTAGFPKAGRGRLRRPKVMAALRETVAEDARSGSAEVLEEPAGRTELHPLTVEGERLGTLALAYPPSASSDDTGARLAGAMAELLAITIALHVSRAALRERVKELTCLYDILHLVTESEHGLAPLLQGIAEILPRACQHPEVAEAQILLDGRTYQTDGFSHVANVLSADIVRGETHRGRVDVGYTARPPKAHASPFLPEERILVEAVARDVGLIAERIEAEERKARLEEQLRHADRLATVGQLATGVAHELNEPLANALGFTQLALKDPALSEQTRQDLDRVISASLRARDTIRRLLLFARQTPPEMAPFDLNDLIEDVLTFFEGRFQQQRIRVARRLAAGPLPRVNGDRSQIRQVLVNLVVNAAQAMPRGGRLMLTTRAAEARVVVVVEDNGVGMVEEVRQQAFLPFFTTKDVDEGTGLGLSVVHGIVTAHQGTIRVDSEPGVGSRFEVELPAASEGGST
jgi:two-component system, NtrC family, sensor kinase